MSEVKENHTSQHVVFDLLYVCVYPLGTFGFHLGHFWVIGLDLVAYVLTE